jgi:hypothetical protein
MTPQTGRVRWRKSSRSGGTNGNCVELAHTLRAVRDSKHPDGPALAGDVADMLAAIRAGHLDR